MSARAGGCVSGRPTRPSGPPPTAWSSTPVEGPVYLTSIAALNHNLGSLPLQPGNRVDLITGYREAITAMAEEVATATTSIEVEFYIAARDDVTEQFFENMFAAADRGVKVRFLMDHMGSRSIPGFKELMAQLDASPVEWRPMLPVRPLKGQFQRPDLRNHRKILIVDGRVAFTGSQNLIEPGYNKASNHKDNREYVELVARVDGPAVDALRAVFAKDWFIEAGENMGDDFAPSQTVHHADGVAGQVLPSGPGYVTENNLRLFTALIYSAQTRVSVTSPYFVPDEPLLYAVTTAARRGVAVELFVSEWGDQFMVSHAQCSYYQALLEAGVRIYLYPAPAVLHSKFFSIDDDVAVIGSSNMDMRSFALNYEVSLMLTGGDIVARFRAVEDSYRAVSRELDAHRVEAAAVPPAVPRQHHAAHRSPAVNAAVTGVVRRKLHHLLARTGATCGELSQGTRAHTPATSPAPTVVDRT